MTALVAALGSMVIITSAAVVFAAWGMTTNVDLPPGLPTPVVMVGMFGLAALLIVGAVILFNRTRETDAAADEPRENAARHEEPTAGLSGPDSAARPSERRAQHDSQSARDDQETPRAERIAGAEAPDDTESVQRDVSDDRRFGQTDLSEGNVSRQAREESRTVLSDDN